MPNWKNNNWFIFLVLATIFAGCNEKKATAQDPTQLLTPDVISAESINVTRSPSTQTSSALECMGDPKLETANVTNVIDGDTIEVNLDGKPEKIRYLMVDTPEMVAIDPKPGRLAKEFNTKMVGGKTVFLARDKTDRDDFGRFLRFVIVDGVTVNYELVEQGFATTFIRPPDELCSTEFTQAMLVAFLGRKGIWQTVRDIVNSSGNSCPEGCPKHLTGCDIKGNISFEGDKIYHSKGSAGYSDVQITTSKGERWFCTLEEAIANGWRPARVD
jgi:micrococcal nuclease